MNEEHVKRLEHHVERLRADVEAGNTPAQRIERRLDALERQVQLLIVAVERTHELLLQMGTPGTNLSQLVPTATGTKFAQAQQLLREQPHLRACSSRDLELQYPHIGHKTWQRAMRE